MNRLLPLIRSKLGAHPTLTNCVYYGSLFCAAEVSQQVYIRKYLPKKQDKPLQSFDTTKLKHLSVWGYVMAPSYMALWYSWLDTRYVATTTRVIALKVVLDQTLLTGPLLLAFFPFMSWCEGKENIFAELREKLLVTYMVSCCWWLPAQAINFKIVPPKYRIIYNGVCGFVWANILCAIKRGVD
eukprot:TRINITY_DN10461_c0_g1_i1.p1 TRINITY_DN10461_c0_g1~~TRINITY_DN10461_c0_g1_i1.p1  ORF type:complete len:184 (+),score=39.21 TRINITY_DN10461_c0_g1_i1:87-638(+)